MTLLLLLHIRVAEVHLRLDMIPDPLFEDFEFGETTLRLYISQKTCCIYLSIPYELPLTISTHIDPDAEPTARLGRYERLQRNAAYERWGEREE